MKQENKKKQFTDEIIKTRKIAVESGTGLRMKSLKLEKEP